MSIVINTNVPALMAAHHVRKTQDGLQTAMERLASGSRINRAGDDAAGAGISQRLMAQVRGADQAMRNVQDAISVVTVADGAMIEVENMLSRAYELVIQKTNASYLSTQDTTAINDELDQLALEIQAIKDNTEFNNTSITGGFTLSMVTGADGTTESFNIPTFLTSTAITSASTAATILTSINSVAGFRGDLASFQNRFEYKVNNLSVLSANTAASLSRIRDADFAAESANVAKFQVLQQAGAAMLAQANASTQTVLTLLQ